MPDPFFGTVTHLHPEVEEGDIIIFPPQSIMNARQRTLTFLGPSLHLMSLLQINQYSKMYQLECKITEDQRSFHGMHCIITVKC